MGHVLIVDDSEDMRLKRRARLEAAGYAVRDCRFTVAEGLTAEEWQEVDALVLDMYDPDALDKWRGGPVLKLFRDWNQTAVALVITSYSSDLSMRHALWDLPGPNYYFRHMAMLPPEADEADPLVEAIRSPEKRVGRFDPMAVPFALSGRGISFLVPPSRRNALLDRMKLLEHADVRELIERPRRELGDSVRRKIESFLGPAAIHVGGTLNRPRGYKALEALLAYLGYGATKDGVPEASEGLLPPAQGGAEPQ